MSGKDVGAGTLHQVAQFPVDQVYLIYKAPMPLSALHIYSYIVTYLYLFIYQLACFFYLLL